MTPRTRFALPALALASLAAACGGGGKSTSTATTAAAPAATGGATSAAGGSTSAAGSTSSGGGSSSVSGSISFTGVWTGAEQKAFQKVLDGFQAAYPNVKVKYTPGGDQLPTVLSTAIAGGNPPDMASLAQPGLVKDFVAKKALKPIDFAQADIAKGYSADWIKLGMVDGKLYGFTFKGANKSTVWFNVKAFSDAGIQPPKTFDELLTDAKTLKASGVTPYSIGGADGWTLTDLFENIYLRQAGPDKYDQLSTHKIPWTDQSVKDALRLMARVVGDTGDVAGGTAGALQIDFPTSVTQTFSATPKAAMVFEGDFVAGTITSSTKAKPGTDFNVFDFPSVNASQPSVVGGGDTVVMFKDTPAAHALLTYLATPEAAEIWAKIGGFSSANKNVPASTYPDDITRKTATALAQAQTFRFDMSDLQPSAFGGTVGQGEFKDFQDFLKDPTNVDAAASALEADAAKAYK